MDGQMCSCERPAWEWAYYEINGTYLQMVRCAECGHFGGTYIISEALPPEARPIDPDELPNDLRESMEAIRRAHLADPDWRM
jgi:hypothetical protein